MSEGLTRQLLDAESRGSAYEHAIRQTPVSPLPLFQGDGTPVFIPSGQVSVRDETIGSVLPGLMSHCQRWEPTGARRVFTGKRVAVLFSGGPASGGHNVVVGLLDQLKGNELWGVRQGPQGLLRGDLFPIDLATRSSWVNTGGFDWLGSDRTKIKTPEQLATVCEVVRRHQLDGLVVIGGDDSNTNAAFLADALQAVGCSVVGVPKTIDGDLQWGEDVPISFGFDTATKIYSELVGNVLQDARSSGKYWHIIKLMGRSASHVALEVALQTHPPITLISEEVAANGDSLSALMEDLADQVVRRAQKGYGYGVMVLPEGVIESVGELKTLVASLNHLMATHHDELQGLSLTDRVTRMGEWLPSSQVTLLRELPDAIATQLLKDRDSHGNIQVSQIPTETLFVAWLTRILSQRTLPPGFVFQPIHHFFGYEGRCGAPTRFDAVYGYNLGCVAAALVLNGATGVMASVGQFQADWQVAGLPLVAMLSPEKRGSEVSWVIEKSLVSLGSPAFRYFASRRQVWCDTDAFSSVGPRQWTGELAYEYPISVALNHALPSLQWREPACVLPSRS